MNDTMLAFRQDIDVLSRRVDTLTSGGPLSGPSPSSSVREPPVGGSPRTTKTGVGRGGGIRGNATTPSGPGSAPGPRDPHALRVPTDQGKQTHCQRGASARAAHIPGNPGEATVKTLRRSLRTTVARLNQTGDVEKLVDLSLKCERIYQRLAVAGAQVLNHPWEDAINDVLANDDLTDDYKSSVKEAFADVASKRGNSVQPKSGSSTVVGNEIIVPNDGAGSSPVTVGGSPRAATAGHETTGEEEETEEVSTAVKRLSIRDIVLQNLKEILEVLEEMSLVTKPGPSKEEGPGLGVPESKTDGSPGTPEGGPG